MSAPVQPNATPTDSTLENLRDVQGVLVLLSLPLALIASPTTSIIAARDAAVMAQHTAIAWAELLAAEISVIGGAQ